jgi:aminopeptidase N
LLQKLRDNINKLPAADRLNLLNDAWAMVEANRAPSTDYLDLVQSLKGEKTFAIWNQILGVFEFIDSLQKDKSGRDAFREFACAHLRPELERVGWKPLANEPRTDVLLRSRLITVLGFLGDKSVIAEAKARYDKFIVKPSSLPADLRVPVIVVAGRYGDHKTFEQLHELGRNAKGTEERQLYYRTMACSLDPELANEALAISLTDEIVPQDATRIVPDVAGFGQPEIAWDFARAHLKQLMDKLEEFRRNQYVPSIMGSFSDAARADEMLAYVKQNVSEDALPKARETAEAIRLKAALKQRELPLIDKWVEAHHGTTPKVAP